MGSSTRQLKVRCFPAYPQPTTPALNPFPLLSGPPQGGAPAKKPAKRPVAAGATAGSSTLASLIKALLPILIVLAAVYYVQLQVSLRCCVVGGCKGFLGVCSHVRQACCA